jgi:D-alanine-D-alanine ligase
MGARGGFRGLNGERARIRSTRKKSRRGGRGTDALGHEPSLQLDVAEEPARDRCSIVISCSASANRCGQRYADYCIAAYLELIGKRITGSGSHGLLYGQDKAVAKKILQFHGIETPVFARSFRGRLDFSHDLEFPVIVKPAREDGSIGIEFSSVVSSIRELMERIDWLHAVRFAGADRGYVEDARSTCVLGETPEACR